MADERNNNWEQPSSIPSDAANMPEPGTQTAYNATGPAASAEEHPLYTSGTSEMPA